ncbi:GyrI-like domain-containing protein [Bosea vestrisii]|jgi:effector-binding domain-containing protein|uniref:GyrI-like domain-containing protein n=2 Tax=Bosea TaxID=85413 RepID=A0ABW0HGB2_9HYPH|nr:AraC family transcriptional regulator [Methylobacterium sp.]
MRQSRFSALLLALALAYPAAAQTRVAPPTAVESTPLAAPPGTATPAQNAQPAQQAPTQNQGNQPTQAEPQPVQPPPAPQSPVTPQPVQPAPAAPAEPQPVQPPPTLPSPQPAPPVQQQQTGTPDSNATLAGKKGDPSDVDEIQLTAKPVLLFAGQASWDQGFQKLAETIALLRTEADKAGLKVAGRPLSLFVETDDNGFKFEAMLPVDKAAAGPLANGVRNGQSPVGRSLRFVHTAPYDDIDSTYETITAYLEAKNIVVKDAFLEEYVSDLKDPGDPNLEINVYVQPK